LPAMAWPSRVTCPRSGVHARDHVEHGALAGAVGADQGRTRRLTSRFTSLLATRPPKRLVTSLASQHHLPPAAGCGAPAGRGHGPARGLAGFAPFTRPRQRPQAVGGALQHQHQQAEHDDLEVAAGAQQRGSQSCSHSLSRVIRPAPSTAPHTARPPPRP
jgi:hypothetical protein